MVSSGCSGFLNQLKLTCHHGGTFLRDGIIRYSFWCRGNNDKAVGLKSVTFPHFRGPGPGRGGSLQLGNLETLWWPVTTAGQLLQLVGYYS